MKELYGRNIVTIADAISLIQEENKYYPKLAKLTTPEAKESFREEIKQRIGDSCYKDTSNEIKEDIACLIRSYQQDILPFLKNKCFSGGLMLYTVYTDLQCHRGFDAICYFNPQKNSNFMSYLLFIANEAIYDYINEEHNTKKEKNVVSIYLKQRESEENYPNNIDLENEDLYNEFTKQKSSDIDKCTFNLILMGIIGQSSIPIIFGEQDDEANDLIGINENCLSSPSNPIDEIELDTDNNITFKLTKSQENRSGRSYILKKLNELTKEE